MRARSWPPGTSGTLQPAPHPPDPALPQPSPLHSPVPSPLPHLEGEVVELAAAAQRGPPGRRAAVEGQLGGSSGAGPGSRGGAGAAVSGGGERGRGSGTAALAPSRLLARHPRARGRGRAGGAREPPPPPRRPRPAPPLGQWQRQEPPRGGANREATPPAPRSAGTGRDRGGQGGTREGSGGIGRDREGPGGDRGDRGGSGGTRGGQGGDRGGPGRDPGSGQGVNAGPVGSVPARREARTGRSAHRGARSPRRPCTARPPGAGTVRAPGGTSGASAAEKGSANGRWQPQPGEQRGVPPAHGSPAAGVQLQSPVRAPSRRGSPGRVRRRPARCGAVTRGRHGAAASLEGVRVELGPGLGGHGAWAAGAQVPPVCLSNWLQ